MSAKSPIRVLWNPINQLIAQALMGALKVIVLHILVYRPTQMPLTYKYHSAKALGLDRQDEAFCVRIQIRTCQRQPHRFHASALQDLTELRCEQRFAIVDQMGLGLKLTRDRINQTTSRSDLHTVHARRVSGGAFSNVDTRFGTVRFIFVTSRIIPANVSDMTYAQLHRRAVLPKATQS